MAGFRRAKAEQAALKMALYGLSGSGKTFTSLLLAEGLARTTEGRIAYVDTERGTDFYCKAVPERKAHPEPFDFDALYTRSITEITTAVRGLDPKEHSVVVIDSVTHLWEAAQEAYSGIRTKAGTIPMHAWGKIKRPYKTLIAHLLNSPMHVFICGRQGTQFEEDEQSGEIKAVGAKMKAEGETPYEPHILLHMHCVRSKNGDGIITAFAEKDRTGVLAQRTINWPCYDNVVRPLLPYLGGTQAQMDTLEDAAQRDSENLDSNEQRRIKGSATLLRKYLARLDLVSTGEGFKKLSAELTPTVKKRFTPGDLKTLRDKWHEISTRFPKQ